MNKVIITGRLVKAPQAYQTSNNKKFTVIRVAAKAYSGKHTDYFSILVYGPAGENAYRYLDKGQIVDVVAHLTNIKSNNDYVNLIIAENIEYGPKSKQSPSDVYSAENNQQSEEMSEDPPSVPDINIPNESINALLDEQDEDNPF